jgi:hypothetical protein
MSINNNNKIKMNNMNRINIYKMNKNNTKNKRIAMNKGIKINK